MLSDEFLEAYEHGVVIKCCDGITRRFYPRIFAYSADYPEKFVPNYLLDLILMNVYLEFFLAVFGTWAAARARAVLFQKIAPIYLELSGTKVREPPLPGWIISSIGPKSLVPET